MSSFDRGLDGGLRAGSSDSNGDATPRSKSPIGHVFSRIDPLNSSFQYPRLGSSTVHHGDGGAFSQLNLRWIWDDAKSPTQQQQQQQQQQTSTTPNAVFPDSPNTLNHGSMSTHRRMGAPHVQARGAYAGPDVRDSDAGLERLRLTESVRQHVQTSNDVPKSWPGSAYFHDTCSEMASTAQSTAEMASQPRHLSIWSPYGARTANDSNSVRDGSIAPTSSQYSAYFAAPPSTRADAVSNPSLRAHSETGFNASAELPMAQRPFTSQIGPPIPIRMGRSLGSAPGNRIASGSDAHQPPVPFYFQPRSSPGFLPMQALGSRREAFPLPSGSSSTWAAPSVSVANPVPSTRFSDRYHGMHTESNASAEHLTPEQNASLWITNLPPDTTHHELLGQIRNIGRVWCSFINGPDGCKHTTAAAKVVFFRPSAARRMLQHAAAPDRGLHIRGFRAKVTQNRIKTGETVPRAGDDSRVLIVTGDACFVNEARLTEWFANLFVFQVDEVRQLVVDEESGLAVVEFRFGSFRCQAQMGKISLEKERPPWFERAEFGEDPCEVGETCSSHAIALQRVEEVKCSRRKKAEEQRRMAEEKRRVEEEEEKLALERRRNYRR
ncbi:hypothetical protein MY4824_001445 [Beauveria thailandica]